jgi:hypothetical protein
MLLDEFCGTYYQWILRIILGTILEFLIDKYRKNFWFIEILFFVI